MPYKFKQLFLFFLLFDLFRSFYMELNGTGSLQDLFNFIDNFQKVVLRITSTFSFYLYALSSYTLLWLFSKRKKHFWAIVLILFCIPIVILFRYLLEEMISPAVFGFHNYRIGIRLSDYIQDNKYFSLPNTAFGVVFYLIQSNQFALMEKKELIIQNRIAELEYLKSQINPHFLFNNLSSIYSLVYHKSDKALTAIEQLSSLLRYMLYEKNQLVSLEEEWNYILNFIELQKIRYSNNIAILIEDRRSNEHFKIAPLILIPLIENAFKHGQFTNIALPIKIFIETKDQNLTFTVSNEKGKSFNTAEPGIGVSNLRRRLELLYPDSFQLEIVNTASNYTTTLKICSNGYTNH